MVEKNETDLKLDKKEIKPQKKVNLIEDKPFIDILKMFSPGTSLRSALDDLLRARMGALIVVDSGKLYDILEGGFRVNCRFNQQRLVELAKMDGAIILSGDLKKILHANVLLSPDIRISTKETGTRHKAGERTAKQIRTVVIAVSERKNKITLYCKDVVYELRESSEVLRRVSETLQILEKQKEIFNDLLVNLNILEINSLVTTSDVCSVLQRVEIIRKISDMVKRSLIELGKEGLVVSMRLKELTKNLDKERKLILEDYFKSKASRANVTLSNMDFDFLLEISNLLRMLFEELHEKQVVPRGLRLLNKTGLSEKEINLLLNGFKDLNKILDADKDSLMKVLKNEGAVNLLKSDLETLREKILVGRKI